MRLPCCALALLLATGMGAYAAEPPPAPPGPAAQGEATVQRWALQMQGRPLPAGQRYALRGSAPPLSWERGLPFSADGRLDLRWQAPVLEAKLVVEDAQGQVQRWERGENRRWLAGSPPGLLRFDVSEQAEALWREVMAADTAFFTAFNAGDVAGTAAMFSDRLEFFHDTGGFSDKAQTMRQFKQNAARTTVRSRRELLPEGMVVYPVPGVGAMQIGQHRFCSQERQADGEFGPPGCSVYGFSHVWERQADGRWQLLRVLSYGH